MQRCCCREQDLERTLALARLHYRHLHNAETKLDQRTVAAGTQRLGMHLGTGGGEASSQTTTLQKQPHSKLRHPPQTAVPTTQLLHNNLLQLPKTATETTKVLHNKLLQLLQTVAATAQTGCSMMVLRGSLQTMRRRAGSLSLMHQRFCWCMALGLLGSSGGAKYRPSLQQAIR